MNKCCFKKETIDRLVKAALRAIIAMESSGIKEFLSFIGDMKFALDDFCDEEQRCLKRRKP